jgi:hypothetical protein
MTGKARTQMALKDKRDSDVKEDEWSRCSGDVRMTCTAASSGLWYKHSFLTPNVNKTKLKDKQEMFVGLHLISDAVNFSN